MKKNVHPFEGERSFMICFTLMNGSDQFFGKPSDDLWEDRTKYKREHDYQDKRNDTSYDISHRKPKGRVSSPLEDEYRHRHRRSLKSHLQVNTDHQTCP